MLRQRPLLTILVVAFALRIAAALFADFRMGAIAQGFASAAACEFTGMAHGLLQHGTFTYFEVAGQATPSAYQPPLYPLFFAGVFSTLGDGTAGFVFVQVVQILLGVGAVCLTYRLAKEVGQEHVAGIAAWLVAVWPTLLYAPVEAHSVSLQIFLLLAVSLSLTRHLRGHPSALTLGTSLALLAMLRSEIVLLLPVLVVLLFVTLRRRAVGVSVVLCLSVLVPTAIWVGRNVRDLGRPILTTTAELNLWRGNGEMATGGSYRWNGEIAWDTPATLAAVKALPWSPDYELKMEGIYAEALRHHLANAPLEPLKLLPIKLGFFLVSDLTHPKGKSPLVVLPALLALPFLCIGSARLWARRRELWPLFFWILAYLAVSLVTFPLPRYRLCVEPFILIVAAVGIERCSARVLKT